MLIFQQTNINPSSIKHVIIKEEGTANIYPLSLVCDYKKELYPNSFVKCQIDLSSVPKGFYRIIILIYGIDYYKINNLLPFLIIGEEEPEPERPVELVDVIENITELSKNQSISFLFSKDEINPQLINQMTIDINRYDKNNISLYCTYERYNMSWLKCYGDFTNIKENKYKIHRINYMRNAIYPSKDIYINVHKKSKENLELLNIRGDIIRGNTTLNLTFNKNVSGCFFSCFYLYSGYNYYNLSSTVLTKYENTTTIRVHFYFGDIPIGDYHLGTSYEGNEYQFSNSFINITNTSYNNNKWIKPNVVYNFINGIYKQKTNLRMPKN